MSYLEIAFPDLPAVISAQRTHNATFDEICRDFEEISTALTNLEAVHASENTDQIVDLKNTLMGLHDEIKDHLANYHTEGAPR